MLERRHSLFDDSAQATADLDCNAMTCDEGVSKWRCRARIGLLCLGVDGEE
ncbi:uncharacterized protein DS421_14g481300 [Arachis hypogaea]|nr:uncharacterized protein DS421_14g481300 [Arachis hypogaea]